MTRPKGDREYFSEFGAANRYGRTLRNLLELGGPRIAPPEMDLRALVPTIDISQGGFGYSEYLPLSSPAVPINGVASNQYAMVTSGDSYDSTYAQWSNNRRKIDESYQSYIGPRIRWDSRLHALWLRVAFDAAGATAAAGSFITVLFLLENQSAILGGAVADRHSVFWGIRLFTIAAATLTYDYNINGGTSPAAIAPQGQPSSLWTRRIPPGWNFVVEVSISAGVFPANTTFACRGGINQVPEGAELPL